MYARHYKVESSAISSYMEHVIIHLLESLKFWAAESDIAKSMLPLL